MNEWMNEWMNEISTTVLLPLHILADYGLSETVLCHVMRLFELLCQVFVQFCLFRVNTWLCNANDMEIIDLSFTSILIAKRQKVQNKMLNYEQRGWNIKIIDT